MSILKFYWINEFAKVCKKRRTITSQDRFKIIQRTTFIVSRLQFGYLVMLKTYFLYLFWCREFVL